ncbi:MAG: CARDB domain-containing protein [Candidatus Bathycorpusculaceae bacterium]
MVISDSNIMDNDGLGMANNTQLMLNMFNWIGVRYEHDLAVSLEAPTFLEPDESSLINATVHNRGLSNETDVELQLFINGTEVESVVIPNGGGYKDNGLGVNAAIGGRKAMAM